MSPGYSESSIEAQVRDLFVRNHWYPLKTDAALVVRGGKRHGTIQTGFPDRVFLLGLGAEKLLTLAALVELKTDTGKLSGDQVDRHRELREWYDINPHVIRTPEQALHLIAEGKRLQRLLGKEQL